MPNEIYHRSNWGESKAEDFGDVYYDHAATNKLFVHSDYYENSDGTDATLKDLNNKASIVLTPTAYSDGSLNTVIPPYQVLPTELVTNGTFDTDSDWLKSSTATISNGSAHIVSDGSYQYIGQVLVLTVGKKYRVEYEIVENNSGSLKMSSSFGSNFNPISSTVGFHSFEAVAIASTLYIERQSSCDIKIDNVSVKEIQEADFDFSRGSSATRVNEQGLVEDSQGDDYPRIDFTDGTGSLLLEPQRTNLVTYSEDFSQSVWTKNDITVTSGFLAPDGTNTAYKVTKNGSNAHLVGFSGQNTNKRKSIWARTVSGTGKVTLLNVTTDTNALFDITEQWQRFDITHSGADFFYAVDFRNASATLTEVLIWGAQLEDGDYATSYIVSNSGSTTTRSADVANNSGNADLFNDSEGVLYVESKALANDETSRVIASISDGTYANRIVLQYTNNVGGNQLIAFIQTPSGYSSVLTRSITNALVFNKFAIVYSDVTNNFDLWVNGTRLGDGVFVHSFQNSLNTIQLADANGTGNAFYGKTKCVAVFKEALSNDLLERLTGEGYESFRLLAEANNYTII